MAPETERWFSVRAPPALNHWTNSAGKQVFSEIVITYKQVRTGKQNACWKQVCFLLKKKKQEEFQPSKIIVMISPWKKARTKYMGREDTIYSTVQYGIYGEKETKRLAHWLLRVGSDIIGGKNETL